MSQPSHTSRNSAQPEPQDLEGRLRGAAAFLASNYRELSPDEAQALVRKIESAADHVAAYMATRSEKKDNLNDDALYQAMTDDRERYRLELLRANLLPADWPAMSAAYMRAWQDGQKHSETNEQYGPTRDELKAMFPLLWHINDHLRITPDQAVEYTGSTNDVDRLRDRLHWLDPNYDLGTEFEGRSAESIEAEVLGTHRQGGAND